MAFDVDTENTVNRPSKEEQLTALFDSCYPRLVRYAYARTSNRTDSEDIAADVFVRAFESLDSYRDRGAPMEAWLFRIAHNLVVDRLRAASRYQRSEEDDGNLPGAPDTAHIAERNLLVGSVKKAMDRLTPDQKEVVSLRFFAGLSAKETADVMHKGHGAVREMQRAAIEKLRGILA